MRLLIALTFVSMVFACTPAKKLSPVISKTRSQSTANLQSGQSAKATAFVREEIFKGKIPTTVSEIRKEYGPPLKVARETVKPFNFEGGDIDQIEFWQYSHLKFMFYVNGSRLLLANTFVPFDLPTLKSLKEGESLAAVIRFLGKGYYSWEPNDYRYFVGQAELVLQFTNRRLSKIAINDILI